MNDQELIELIHTNAAAGIEEAMKCYGGAAKTICKAYLPGYREEELEEAISDCFVALWQSVGNFDEEKNVSLKSYFYGIARRVALNRRRKLAGMEECEEISEMIEAPDEVEREAIGHLDCEILRELVLQMDSPDKEVFVYRFFHQYSVKEVAKQLSMTAKAVENRIARGKDRLRKQLMANGVSL